jgi:hypothetical protein
MPEGVIRSRIPNIFVLTMEMCAIAFLKSRDSLAYAGWQSQG